MKQIQLMKSPSFSTSEALELHIIIIIFAIASLNLLSQNDNTLYLQVSGFNVNQRLNGRRLRLDTIQRFPRPVQSL